MHILPSKYRSETFHCYANTPIDGFRQQLSEYFAQESYNTNSLFINMKGRFLTKTEFEITPVSGGSFNSVARPLFFCTSLTGELFPNGDRTEVVFLLSPDYFYFYSALPIIIGLVGLHNLFTTDEISTNRMYFEICIIVCLLVLLPFVYFRILLRTKENLKQNFITALDLHQA